MNHLRDLPNHEGFKFVGINHDGNSGNCHVVKEKSGNHTVAGDFMFYQLVGWKHEINNAPENNKAEEPVDA